MKIALVGYGKMGHAVERIALERGHEIVAVIDRDNTEEFDSSEFKSADVAVEFSTPATAADNIISCVRRGVPVVCGSTGWSARREEVERIVNECGSALLASSNFSIGVNVMFELNRRLAAMMEKLPQYSPSLSETHHIHKLDHPSGTAITLLDGIIDECARTDSWAEPDGDAPLPEGVIPVSCERRGEVPGIHTVTWTSAVDSISISHDARSRDGFALGAVMGAEWLPGHTGIFTMRRLLSELKIL